MRWHVVAVRRRVPRLAFSIKDKSGGPPCVGVLGCRAAQQREHDRQTTPRPPGLMVAFLMPGNLGFSVPSLLGFFLWAHLRLRARPSREKKPRTLEAQRTRSLGF